MLLALTLALLLFVGTGTFAQVQYGGVIKTQDNAPATQNITTVDLVSATASGANSQSIITGTPTANTGAIALYYDITNDQLYAYNGSWKQPKTPAGAAIVNWQ